MLADSNPFETNGLVNCHQSDQKVQVGNNKEKVQKERDSHFKSRGG